VPKKAHFNPLKYFTQGAQSTQGQQHQQHLSSAKQSEIEPITPRTKHYISTLTGMQSPNHLEWTPLQPRTAGSSLMQAEPEDLAAGKLPAAPVMVNESPTLHRRGPASLAEAAPSAEMRRQYSTAPPKVHYATRQSKNSPRRTSLQPPLSPPAPL
jgi:hypothetical protein